MPIQSQTYLRTNTLLEVDHSDIIVGHGFMDSGDVDCTFGSLGVEMLEYVRDAKLMPLTLERVCLHSLATLVMSPVLERERLEGEKVSLRALRVAKRVLV